jgi:hypothetical protein
MPAERRTTEMKPEDVAQMFHETYERLAPSHGYETRKASAVPWSDVPEPNRSLMIAVAGEVGAEIEREVREQIAQDLLAVDPVEWALAGQNAGLDAARIARGGER